MSAGPTQQAIDEHGDGRLPTVEPPPSLAEHVRRVLRHDILSGRLAPGARLTEALVTERTGVSRTPAREGMRLLQGEGLVNAQRGRGTFVTDRLSSEEALKIYGMRLVIEPFMTSLAAKRATTAELGRCEKFLARYSAAVEDQGDSRTISSIDAQFHKAIYDASHSALVAICHSYWAKLELQLSTRVYDRETPARFLAEHVAILAAIRDGDDRAAGKLMAAHIRHGRELVKESFTEGPKR
ncbi:MAG: GntR family transcriptional regulator [Trebonia sp.]